MSRKKTGKKLKNTNKRDSKIAGPEIALPEQPPGRIFQNKTPQKNSWNIARLLFVVGFTVILVLADSYLNLERKVSDFLADFPFPFEKNSEVVIVEIDEEDYKNLFGSTSPLSPDRVTEIVKAILLGKPKILGIDIFTSDEVYKKHVLIQDSPPPIVWVDEPAKNPWGRVEGVKSPLGELLIPDKYNQSGLPGMPTDSDGITRLYRRGIDIRGQRYPTITRQIYQLVREPDKMQPNPTEANTPLEDYYIGFLSEDHRNQRPVVSASQILDASLRGDIEEIQCLLKDKIVLFGGRYSDSRDKGLVPSGELYGVDILASVLDTELAGNPLKPVSLGLKIFLNVLMILIFVLNFLHYGFGKKSLLIALFAIFILAIFISLIQYNDFSGVPLLISIFFYGLFIALLDLVMDKYKDAIKSLIAETGKAFRGARGKGK